MSVDSRPLTSSAMPPAPPLDPRDSFNQRLEAAVHPADWRNPIPRGKYNLVVIGGGTAGLVAAVAAAGLGGRVALVERDLLGGDCLNFGCVPSKALIASARAAAHVRRAGEFGIRIPRGPTVDFPAVMERMRRIRAELAPHDSAERLRHLGIDVYFGSGRFVDSHAIEVADQHLSFARACIATGARPSAPPIPGLDGVDFLTNESLFSLAELPPRLGIVGAGPIGVEIAQCFARFGSIVHLIESSSGVLPREDPDAGRQVRSALERDGVRVACDGRDLTISRPSAGTIRMDLQTGAERTTLEVDRLLVAAGRSPNVAGLGLEQIGVEYDQHGIRVNDRLQTTVPHVFAAGDVCSPFKFTHAADFMARHVVRNALFPGRARMSDLVIPWATYCDPEVARVGLNLRDAAAAGIDVDAFTQDLGGVDRAVLDGEVNGFVRILVRKGTDRIVGATVVAPHAGDLIGAVSLAMTQRIGLRRIAATILPYPTAMEAIRRIGDQFNRTRLTPGVASLLGRWLAWSRR